MLLDKLLSYVQVRVEPFAACLLDSSWRVRLPGPPDAMFRGPEATRRIAEAVEHDQEIMSLVRGILL